MTRSHGPDHADPAGVYRRRRDRFAAERDRFEERALWISNARVVTFLGAVVFLLVPTMAAPSLRPAFFVTSGLLLVVFFGLVHAHARARARRRWFEELRRANDEAEKRLRRAWDAFPVRELRAPPADHPYAADLDLFGHASLFRLLGAPASVPGRTTLRGWLLDPAPPSAVPARQRAVAELAPLLDLRDELTAHGRLMGDVEPEALDRFLAWAEGEPWLSRRPVLVWTARALPVLTTVLIALDAAGIAAYPLWALPIAAALLVTRGVAPAIRGTLARASAGDDGLRRYHDPLALLARAPLEAPLLRTVQDDLSAGGLAAHRQMRRLGRLIALSEVRYSMLHLPIHLLTLWDFHVLHALERWQQTAGPHVRRWLAALGRAEALSALAALAHAHPDWSFPEVVDGGEARLEAERLAHPLLRPDTAVPNDVVVGPPGTFVLVTGSNMSGKSTLLRAIGVNVVLAQAGGPVSAARMRLPPVTLFTSMRVQDSLEQGLSQFMAELRRVKEVVDAARRAATGGERTLLYLLDEVLRGTNTIERRIAVRRILRHLLDTGAIGAVTTHDLELADAEGLAAATRPIHFREMFEPGPDGPVLSFDYRLRPGLATSTNALALLALVGLDD